MPETNDNGGATENGAAEGQVQLTKSEYEELVGLKATFGSTKRELKDVRQELEELRKAPRETAQTNKTDEFGLLEKAFLRSSGYNDPDEFEVFKKWSKDTGKSIDLLVDHPFIKAEIETLRTTKANQAATSNVSGQSGTGGDKNSPEYWVAKIDSGQVRPEDLPEDRKLRAAIMKKKMASTKDGRKFYNE